MQHIFALAIVHCGAQLLLQCIRGGWSRWLKELVLSDEKPASAASAVVIKKYANRRLYNTATSTYVTLDDLAAMVKSGTDFVVYDAKTGEEITRSVLTQIIFEEESKGTNLLPVNFLRQLIRFYGDSMQAFVPGFLEFSLDNLGKEQEKFRGQMMEAWRADPFKAVQDSATRNMSMFQEAMRMFNPFAAAGSSTLGVTPKSTAAQPQPAPATGKDDLQLLKDQLAAMQQRLDSIVGK